ncbi:hypothetical protein FNYG_08612 [Fusarium nygamai]|uniref:Uncharacterized protein n=1 Tax=Gibberella nygamai TaxID=42673 RepID=A0A2K0W6K3_GIBNY|nr:hypothetical protein FNYG_08612 [Fusarium nygamai]
MDIRDKQLPPIPEERKTCSYKEVAPSCMQYGNPCSPKGIRKENEDLKKANEILLRKYQELAFEYNIFQDKTEKELEHRRKIIEIQKESLKSIRQWVIVSTTDCRKKCTELEQTTTEDSVRSIDATMF